MKLKDVFIQEDGRPYRLRERMSGRYKGQIMKDFGTIFFCIVCKEESFAFSSAKNKFCSISCRDAAFNKGSNHRSWKGGKHLSDSGYVMVYKSEIKDYVREHRQIMEKELGRKLNKNEHVHHINYDRRDNRIENLKILNPSEHAILHLMNRSIKRIGFNY